MGLTAWSVDVTIRSMLDRAAFPLTAIAYDRETTVIISLGASIAAEAVKYGTQAKWQELFPGRSEMLLADLAQRIRLCVAMENEPEVWERRLRFEGEGDLLGSLNAGFEEHF